MTSRLVYEVDRTASGTPVARAADGDYCRVRVFGEHGLPVVGRQTGSRMAASVVGRIVGLHASSDGADLHYSLPWLHPSGDEKSNAGVVSPFDFIADFRRGLSRAGRLRASCPGQFSVKPVPLLIPRAKDDLGASARHFYRRDAPAMVACARNRMSSDAAPTSNSYLPGSTTYFFRVVSQQRNRSAGNPTVTLAVCPFTR